MTRGIIIGGGIGGLAAAAALRRVGVECAVYEQAPELREVGAGLTLWANALRALRQLDLAEPLLRQGSKTDAFEVRTASGRVLVRHDFGPLECKLRAPVNVTVLRADLLRELAGHVDPSRVHFNSRVVSVSQTEEEVTACIADGEQASADFLIGADGLHSVVRSQFHREGKPRYAGYTCWRGVAEMPSQSRWNIAVETWGAGARFAIHPCGTGRVFWYATRNAKEGEPDSPSGRKSELRAFFGHWHTPIPQTIEATPQDQILRNDIVDHPPIDQWGAGRITLLGDAAHPTTPNLGQGACQAIEDAIVLADCLRGSDAGVEQALRTYEKKRRSRTAAITNLSWRSGQLCQWESPLACAMRNLLVRIIPARLSLLPIAKLIDAELPTLSSFPPR